MTMATTRSIERGILRPFRRDQKNDFANASGRELFESRAGQILGMRASSPRATGELRWRPALGSKLHLLRHKRINPTTRELARYYAQEALGRWDARTVVTGVTLSRVANAPGSAAQRTLIVTVSLSIYDRRANRVLANGLVATARISE